MGGAYPRLADIALFWQNKNRSPDRPNKISISKNTGTVKSVLVIITEICVLYEKVLWILYNIPTCNGGKCMLLYRHRGEPTPAETYKACNMADGQDLPA